MTGLSGGYGHPDDGPLTDDEIRSLSIWGGPKGSKSVLQRAGEEITQLRARIDALQAENEQLRTELKNTNPDWARPLLSEREAARKLEEARQAENERLRDRVTELDAAITAYMLGHIDGGEVSRVQHREWFPRGGAS